MLKLALVIDTRQCSSGFSLVKLVFFPSFVTTHLGSKSLGTTHTPKEWKIMYPSLRVPYLHTLCGIILYGKFVSFLHILIYTIIHLYQNELRYLFYTLGYNPLPVKIFFSFFNLVAHIFHLSTLPPLEALSVGSCTVWNTSKNVFLKIFNTFLLFSTVRGSKPILYISPCICSQA